MSDKATSKASPTGRYMIDIGFGECSPEEAEALCERVADALYGGTLGDTFGAVVALGPWMDEEAA